MIFLANAHEHSLGLVIILTANLISTLSSFFFGNSLLYQCEYFSCSMIHPILPLIHIYQPADFAIQGRRSWQFGSHYACIRASLLLLESYWHVYYGFSSRGNEASDRCIDDFPESLLDRLLKRQLVNSLKLFQSTLLWFINVRRSKIKSFRVTIIGRRSDLTLNQAWGHHRSLCRRCIRPLAFESPRTINPKKS